MNFEEFLTKKKETENQEYSDEHTDIQSVEEETSALDVQKAVVESLAADKAEQDEIIAKIKEENIFLTAEVERLKADNERLENIANESNRKVAGLLQQISQQREALEKVGDVLSKNSEAEASNKIALLDRDVEIPDRFPGETRDHVLLAIKEAKEKAEAEGRIRRAQVLEGVMVANESSGNLDKKRENLEKFFKNNQNILSGPVIEELVKYGISYKNGEEYLLPSEIVKRNY